jgi:imidazolonepropionase
MAKNLRTVPMTLDTLITNVNIASCDPAASTPYGAMQDAALGISGNRISWVGTSQQAATLNARSKVNGQGGWLTPGLIDCHTHLVYAGNRAEEFAERLRGVAYEDIARRGGGIISTVTATRQASEEELIALALPRLQALAAEGVCCLEIKSGYGLDCDNELKMLRVARELGRRCNMEVVTTLLAAHALPPEFTNRADAYIELVCSEILPAAVADGLVDAVDVFCEQIAFSRDQCEQVFRRARELNVPVKGHVEQLSNSGGATLVAEYAGLSADHIEYLAPEDVASLAQAGTVAVLLPGAFYTLGETRKPPIAALRQAAVPIAIATDLNPGSSPLASLLLNMNMACVLFGLTPEESLAGTTCHAARALGLGSSRGQLKPGFHADLVLWQIQSPAELSYGHGLVKPQAIWRRGQHVD